MGTEIQQGTDSWDPAGSREGEQRAGIQQEQSWGPAESWDPGGLLGFPSVQGQQSTALQGWCEGVKLLLKTISDVPLIHLFCVGAVQMQLLCI